MPLSESQGLVEAWQGIVWKAALEYLLEKSEALIKKGGRIKKDAALRYRGAM